MNLKEQKIIINGKDETEKFKTEQDVYLTASWFRITLYDGKPFNNDSVLVNGLNQYFIELDDGVRVYFADVKTFTFYK